MSPKTIAEALQEASGGEDRRFRRIERPEGGGAVVSLRWGAGPAERSTAVVVPEPTVEVVGFEVDPQGHVFQDLLVAEASCRLFPILVPFSMEHALSIDREILPEVTKLHRSRSGHEAWKAFDSFWEIFRAIRVGEGDESFLSGRERSVVESLKAEIGQGVSEEVVRNRAFARFYVHLHCDTDAYRAKAEESLSVLVREVSTRYEASIVNLENTFRREGFREDAEDAPG